MRLVRTMEEAAEYLLRMTGPVLAQPYHPGPFEAGVFYYRLPGWKTGRILAITDKHFPAVTGDGRSSIEDLIWGTSATGCRPVLFWRVLVPGAARYPRLVLA